MKLRELLKEFKGGPENTIIRQGQCPKDGAAVGAPCIRWWGQSWWFPHRDRWPGGLDAHGLSLVRSRCVEIRNEKISSLIYLIWFVPFVVFGGPGWLVTGIGFYFMLWAVYGIGPVILPEAVLVHRARTGELLPPMKNRR